MITSRLKSKFYFKRKFTKGSFLIKYTNILMLTYRMGSLFHLSNNNNLFFNSKLQNSQ